MKKNITFLIILLYCGIQLFAQKSNDLGRIVLNPIVLNSSSKIPEEAVSNLESMLTQIAADKGIGGISINPRFVIAAKLNLSSKDIVAGPPQMFALNIDMSIFIGDAIENKVFSSTVFTIKGVGTNENKAYIDAIKKINLKSPKLITMIDVGKNKIIEYYNSQCSIIIAKVNGLKSLGNYDEAIYELMQVPDVSNSCYDNCMTQAEIIYKLKIDRDCKQLLNTARLKWTTSKSAEGAKEAMEYLKQIDQSASCTKELENLMKEISQKLNADEIRDWELKMKLYTDAVDLEKRNIEAAKEIAVSYYNNQPNTIIYNTLIW